VRDWVEKIPAFAAQVTRARAQAMKHMVIKSQAGGTGSSNAEFHLQRRFREDYGPPRAEVDQPNVTITIEGGLPRRP
jgi:hypothetical protein